MSETTNLKLKKHDNPETNKEKFDVENYLNGNWDKIDKNVGEVNTNISNINSKNKEQDTNIEQLQENTKTSSNKITELETELKEMQEDFYQNSIRGQASGEYIHVEDSSNCRAKIGIGGNSEQETRSGKNILELMEGTYSNNGITAVVKDGVITLNGTATAISFVGINLLKSIELTNDKTYHLSAFNEKTAGDSTNYCSLRINQDNIQVLFNKTNANGSITTNLKISYITIRTQTGITYNNFVVKPQLEIGNGTDTWEQGGVSPSLDYPSQVKAVGDNVNLFDITRYDYRNLAGADVQINDKTNFRISATSNGNANCAVGFKVMDLTKYAGKTLTIKAYVKSNTSTNKAFFVLRQNNADYTGTKSNELYDESQNTTNGSITLKYKVTDTVNDNNRYLFIWFYATRGVACNIGDYVDYKVKLAEGTEVGEYSKYGQGSVKVTKCNKNLFDKNTTTDGKYIGGNGSIQTQSNIMHSDYIQIKTNINYYITGRSDLSRVALYDKNKTFLEITSTTQPNGVLNITNSNCKYIIINALLTNKDTLQIEEKTATAYEEHQGQSYIMPTQQSFKSVGDIRDTFIKKDGKWYERHNIYRYLFTGNENFKALDNNSIFGMRVTENKAKIVSKNSSENLTNCLSNRFVNNTQSNTAKMSNKIAFSQWSDAQFLYLSKIKDSVGELKSYLAANETYVDYPLETPIDIECTEEQSKILDELTNARTYKNVTNITTDSKAILSLDYVKDQETQNNKMQNEIDEIKQLLSTTQTSALLLDNMQTDIESEVE